MKQHPVANSVLWRLILFRRRATELLLFETNSRMCLPVLEIPARSRSAQGINVRAKAMWNIDILSLYALRTSDADSGRHYHVVEALRPDAEAPQAALWIPLSVLTRDYFEDDSEFAAVETWLEQTTNTDSRG